MEGKGPEFSPLTSETSDKGFSEKRAARVIEGKQADNSQVKKRKPFTLPKQKVLNRAARTAFQKDKTVKRAARGYVSLKEKILKAYDKNAEEIQRLMQSFTVLSSDSFAASEQLMTEMRARQHLQEELLNALAMDTQGSLTEDTLSKELADLIK